ncbi:MAG: preprotein translocase subunit SecG [Patescibacteria group bacterium]|nr:preprotein translocase subunit SecG [bacterium]MDZ4240845.1 preprotein translocase subunit SecG [Patescibacteria group bacterium]
MDFAAVLPFTQILLAILLIGGILLQRSEASLGSAFGVDGFSSTRYARRGFEKLLFNGTIVVAILFIISTFIALIS